MLIAFLIALLSGMGVGSAGLLVVWLTVADATPQLAAQGLNLFFFLFSSSASLLIHIRKRKIYVGAVAVMTAAGLVGAFAGASLATHTDPGLLRRLFGGMLTLTGAVSAYGALFPKKRSEKAIK